MSALDAPFVQTSHMSRRHAFSSGVESVSQTNNASGLTFRAAHAFRGKPAMVRILFYNNFSTAVTYAKVGAATMRQVSPSLSPASTVEWTQGAPVTVPAAQPGTNNPSANYSAWMPVYPQESLDDPGTYLVTVFAYLDQSFTTYNANNYDVSWMESQSKVGGGWWAQRNQAGDQATNPGTFSSTAVQVRGPIAGIEALCENGSVIVMDCGDSITAGAGQTNLGQTDIYRACVAINSAVAANAVGAKTVSHVRCGWGGQNSATYGARCLYMLPIIRPDILVLTAGTPNDGVPSLTGQVANRAIIQQIIDLAKSQGTRVILRGWAPHSVVADNWPQGTLTTTPTYPVATVNGDVYRLDQNARSLAMDGYGNVSYTAGMSVLGDGAVPERYQAQYTTDLNHPNDAGYAFATTNMQAAILRLLAKFK
ncbi:SGNH/GDSL hydrolase family protein [Paraburkholderia phytofirmans]|uniref:SGNH/GDSL hydrolase family protein n=1 Tax=Paraburkholderia phytofirmans TaxID=261302 RepID=UPI0038B89C48